MKKGWESIKGWLPNTHEWYCDFATKRKCRGRAIRGIIIRKK